jgi:hypothetical protein
MFKRKALVVAVASAVVGVATFVSTHADARPNHGGYQAKQYGGHNRFTHRPAVLPRPIQNRPAQRSQFPLPASFCQRHPGAPQCRLQGKGQPSNTQASICRIRPWLPHCRQQSGNTNNRPDVCRVRPWLPHCRQQSGGISNRPDICRQRPWLSICRPHGNHAGIFCHRHPHHPVCRPRPFPVVTPVITRPIVTAPVVAAAVAAPAIAAPAVAVPTAYPAAPTSPAASNCACLVKEYLSDGSVMFRDVCTNEAAIGPASQAAATPQTPPAQ